MFKLNSDEIKRLKKEYPEGTRIELISMDDPYPIPDGTRGTVTSVDDIGQIHVTYDNVNRSLAIVPGKDKFRKL